MVGYRGEARLVSCCCRAAAKVLFQYIRLLPKRRRRSLRRTHLPPFLRGLYIISPPENQSTEKKNNKTFQMPYHSTFYSGFPRRAKIIPFLRESFCSFRSGGINWLFTSSSSNFIFRQIKFAFSPPSLLPLFRKNKSPFPFLSNQSFLLFPPSLLHSECKFWGWRERWKTLAFFGAAWGRGLCSR